MVIKHLAVFLLVLAAACNKPSEDECKKAIENMRKLMGTASYVEDITPYVRNCRGGSTKDAVQCATVAKTRDELLACKFVHFDDTTKSSSSGSGSGSSGSGSAGSGSAK